MPRLTYLTWKLFHLCMDHGSSRQVEHSSGSAQQSDQASGNRVGSQLSNFQSHHSKMGGARNRLVHHQTEQAAAHLRQPLPRPSGVRHRCPEHGLVRSSLSVPLPYVTYPSGVVAEGEAVRQHQSWYSVFPSITLCASHRGKVFWFRTFPGSIGFTELRIIFTCKDL